MVTASKAATIARRKAVQSVLDDPEEYVQLRTLSADLLQALRHQLQYTGRIRFPSLHYLARPVDFFRDILGVEPWSEQIKVIEAVRDHPRVSVSSGHKVSKSHTAAGLALWWFTLPDARVIMTSTTARQVDQILWREVRMLRARSAKCLDCKRKDPEGLLIPTPCEHSALIDGDQGELARTGLKSSDFREIVGFTAREAEAVAGISGKRLLYIVDEASGVPDEIFDAIEGNRAGGAKIVLFGNPTRNEGEFYEAFHSKAHLYFHMRISSESTPNVVQGREVIPGLATREWIEEKKIEWGEDSPMYQVRVKGNHAIGEDAKIFSIHTISQAELRWNDTPEAGRLFIGLDPAGESGTGDETAYSARRGLRHVMLRTARGLNDEGHLSLLLAVIAELRVPRETPVVVLDREGKIGASLWGKLQAFADLHREAPPFELIAVRASDKAVRMPMVYDRMRDELCANLYQWMKDGGAILSDTKLAKELHAPEWKQGINGRLKATPKDVLKKQLGRSPDRFDSLALSVWEPLSLQDFASSGVPQAVAQSEPQRYAEMVIDPYAALNTWGQ